MKNKRPIAGKHLSKDPLRADFPKNPLLFEKAEFYIQKLNQGKSEQSLFYRIDDFCQKSGAKDLPQKTMLQYLPNEKRLLFK